MEQIVCPKKMVDNFATFERSLRTHVDKMTKDVNQLFVVDIDKDKLWEMYLNSFPEGTNPIFRKRTEHDCSCCRHFVKAFGNVVAIKNNKITTIWDFGSEIVGSKYEPVVNTLAAYIRSRPVIDIFTTETNKIGTEKNHELCESSGEIKTWEHFHVELPKSLINCTRQTADTIRGRARDLRNVFKRSLEEISGDAVDSVLELIYQNSLYRGEEWKTVIETFRKHQISYDKLFDVAKENYTWEQASIVGPVIGKIRNHSIGVLLVDLSNGMDLDEAVRRYEKIVAPSNYKRPKAIFTAKMLKDAEKTITELGYLSALGRRYATLDDITVNNILFANRDVIHQIKGSIFEEMAKEVAVVPKKFDKIEQVPILKFVNDILPTAKSVEVLLENKHSGNLVSLIAPTDINSKTMFKWNNNFSWAYSGNIADSMKERVKAAGGEVGGVLRFSIQWNENHDNEDDLDAHCTEPNGNDIYFGNKGRRHPSTGMLDVDIINPSHQTKDGIAVENINWLDTKKMLGGTYKFYVHNYNHHGGRSGFSAEIEFDGQIYSFAYSKPLRQDEKVQVAEVIYNKTTRFSIVEKIPSSLSSRKLWNLDTNQFHPVQVVMYSPNYWDEQNGVGNRHYFFMLKECKNDEHPNGFFNEYLKNELLEHKRVFEALGSKMRVEPSDNQLSGVGFSSTQRNELVVRVEGNVNRVLKVVF